MPNTVRTFAILACIAFLPRASAAELSPIGLAQAAAAHSAAGRLPESAEAWTKAAAGFGKAADRERQVGALLRAAAALQLDGKSRLALQTLLEADSVALPGQRAQVQVALGGA